LLGVLPPLLVEGGPGPGLAPETPLIPEAEGIQLLLGGLLALGLLGRPWRAARERWARRSSRG
jgi:hypothetical protein